MILRSETSLINAKSSLGVLRILLILARVFVIPSAAPITAMMLAAIDNGSAIVAKGRDCCRRGRLMETLKDVIERRV